MDVVAAGLIDGAHLLAETGKVRGEDRRSDLDGGELRKVVAQALSTLRMMRV